mgnify:CR=1 FL=1
MNFSCPLITKASSSNMTILLAGLRCCVSQRPFVPPKAVNLRRGNPVWSVANTAAQLFYATNYTTNSPYETLNPALSPGVAIGIPNASA